MSKMVSGMKEIKYSTTRAGEGGKLLTSGSVIFFVKSDGQKEERLEVPFTDAQNEDDAYNQALKALHVIAAAFGQIPSRVTDRA